MLNIDTILQSLSEHRPVFHSEADFQHSLAWEIHKHLPDTPDTKIWLEYPYPPSLSQTKPHIDIWISDKTEVTAIELKYIPRQLSRSVKIQGEVFNPKSGAGGRLGFIKDIRRLEEVVSSLRYKSKRVTGYAILLTSYVPYWQPVKKSVAAHVDLHDKTKLQGLCHDVRLKGRYLLHWVDYNIVPISPEKYGFYRYLAVKVG